MIRAIRGLHQIMRKASVALVPPKPNELDSAARIFIGRAVLGTKSRSHCGSWLNRFAVGGATWSRNASTVNTASMPPAAPSKCPVIDLVDDTASLAAWSPKQRLTATHSAMSPTGVEVPCALM